MRAAWNRQSETILYQGLDIRGRVWAVRGGGMSDRRRPTVVGTWFRWEGWVDGMESVFDEGVRHSFLTVRRGDLDDFESDNLRRRDGISSPIPVGRSQILGCSFPALLILVL